MERRLKLGISRMFGLSFFSCRNRDASAMAQDPIFISSRDIQHPLKPPQPPPLPVPVPPLRRFPSLCPSRKAIVPAESQKETRTKLCPPAPPTSPLNSCRRMQEIDESVEKGKRKEKPRKMRSCRSVKDGKKSFRGKENFDMMVPSTSSADSYCFFSSEEEREVEGMETLFSRKSFSSDSSWESHRRRRLALRRRTRRRKTKPRKENSNTDAQLSDLPARARVKGSFAVVKRSRDPHADFRSSMVEMIMEKKIFGAQELEQLLYCFLSLNSACHHRAILEVFEEICEALFCNWS
ncbi:transcription repressor OFP8-like [Aristolochia californica]|uniref:transcription repressor OFP8-like n=1 Tax=Aristolochia californica TaxID=171875 RepID=UPI0035E09199